MLDTTYVKRYVCDRCGEHRSWRVETEDWEPYGWYEVATKKPKDGDYESKHFCELCGDELFGDQGICTSEVSALVDTILVLHDCVDTLVNLLEVEDDVESVKVDEDYTVHVKWREPEEDVEWESDDEAPTVEEALRELGAFPEFEEYASQPTVTYLNFNFSNMKQREDDDDEGVIGLTD